MKLPKATLIVREKMSEIDLVKLQVVYGPVHGEAATRAGNYVWQCNTTSCCTQDGEYVGAVVHGYTPSLGEAKRAAEVHAATHRILVRAVYYAG